MQTPRLFQGQPLSVAEQVLRESLIRQRDELVKDMAEFIPTVENAPRLYEFVARARVLMQQHKDVRRVVAEANCPPSKEK